MKYSSGDGSVHNRFVRLTYFLCSLLYPVFGLVFYWSGIESITFFYQKAVLVGLFSIPVVYSYYKDEQLLLIRKVAEYGAFVFTTHYLYVMAVHNFSLYHMIGLLVVYLVASFIFSRAIALFIYSAFVVIGASTLAYYVMPESDLFLFFFITLLIFSGFTTLAYGRRLQSEANFTRLNSSFYTLFKDSTDALLLINPENGEIVNCNSKAIILLGAHSEAEIMGKDDGFFIGRDNTVEALVHLNEQRRNKDEFQIHMKLRTLHSKEFWADASFKKVTLQGKTRLLLRINDISSMKEIEKELETSQFHLSIVKEITTLPIVGLNFEAVVDASLDILHKYFPSYRIVFSHLTEHNELQVNNCKTSDELRNIAGQVYDLSVLTEVLEALHLRLPVISNDVNNDVRFSGLFEQFGSLESAATMFIPLQRVEGRLGVLSMGCHQPHVWTLYEITTIKDIADYLALIQADMRSFELLRESEERRESIIQSIPDSILLIDHDLVIREVVNPERYPSKGPGVMNIGTSLLAYMPKEFQPEVKAAVKDSIRHLAPKRFEYTSCADEGTLFFEGRVHRYAENLMLVLIRDITSRKRFDTIMDAEKEILELATYGASIDVTLYKLLKTIEGIDNSILANVLMLGDDRITVKSGIAPGMPVSYVEKLIGVKIGPEVGTCGAAMFFNKTFVAEDIQTDPKWKDFKDMPELEGIKSCVSIPLRSKEGEVLGSFAAYSKTGKEHPSEMTALFERAARLASLLIIKDMIRQELEHSENLYRNVVQSQSELVFRMTPQFAITFTNSAFDRFCNVSGEVLEGRNVRQMFDESMHKEFLIGLDQCIENAKKVTLQDKSWNRNGNPRWHEWVITPVLNNQQETVVEIQAVGRDITTMKLAEEKLKRNELLLRSINANINDGIYRTNASDDLLVYANKAFLEMFGYETIDEINKKPIYHLYHESTKRDEFLDIFKSKGYLSNEEVLFKRKDGSVFWGLISSTRVVDPDGKVYFDGAIRDVSDVIDTKEKLIQKNHELRKLNSELDSFVYSASHNLRSPLSSILGLVNIARLENKPLQYLDLIERSVQKLDGFITDIVNYSRNSRLDVNFVPIDFHQLCWDTINNNRYLDGAENIRYIVEAETVLPMVSDFERVRMVIENMVSNAIKFSDRHKPEQFISIRLHTTEDLVHIEVKDNGIGIPRDQHDKIFRMFYRATDRSVGSGIGLYIVKESVEKLHGKVELHSDVDQGTTFNIVLPNSLKGLARKGKMQVVREEENNN